MKQKYDLEERLINFALQMMKLTTQIQKSKLGHHFSNQIGRSGSSPALNYGEAQAAESKKDFVHKLKIILKELRETRISLILIIRHPLVNSPSLLESDLQECNELIGIFTKSIKTVKSRMNSK